MSQNIQYKCGNEDGSSQKKDSRAGWRGLVETVKDKRVGEIIHFCLW